MASLTESIKSQSPEGLKPCPFCGATPDYIDEVKYWTGMRYNTLAWRIQHWCGGWTAGKLYMEVKSLESKEALVEFWNRRAE